MNFVAVETPSARIPASRESLEFLYAPVRVVIRKALKIITDELVQALAE